MITHNLRDIHNLDAIQNFFGSRDENADILRNEYKVNIFNSGTEWSVTGEEENTKECIKVINLIFNLINKGEKIDKNKVKYCIDLVKTDKVSELEDMTATLAVTAAGKPVKCRTYGQRNYVKAIKNNSIVIGVGPAGTGKTYLAVALAVAAYKNREVDKIVLTRPAIEAGEKLGFLPGSLEEKVDPYLRPLFDALQEMLGTEQYSKLLEREIIEVAPLAYMRGRTLNRAFIILDEAQNTTVEQMKMFLTRMGEGSKIIVNGDITQIDLPRDKASGLKDAVRVLTDIPDIAIVILTNKDVIRHELVQSIIKAYEKSEAQNR